MPPSLQPIDKVQQRLIHELTRTQHSKITMAGDVVHT